MSNLMGKLADRASIMKSAFSEMETAVIKATKHNTKAPKEKHVRRLVVFTHDEPHRIPEMIVLLAKRLEFPDWLVVMKTLCVFHRLMRDGNLAVINELRYKSNLFNLRKFGDTTSPEAHHQSIFIRKYSQYLEEKVLVYKILSVEFEKDASITKSYTIDEAFERIPRLQSQMNALLNCRASKDHLNNSIIINAFGMLLKDSFKLYKALNDGIINLLEHYFTMPKPNATKALDIYKLFAKETDGIIQFYDISRKISRTDLPELQHAPTTLVEALENYIKELDEGKAPGTNQGADKKHMDKLVREGAHMDKFEFFETNQQEDSDSDDDSRAKYPSKTSNNASHSNQSNSNFNKTTTTTTGSNNSSNVSSPNPQKQNPPPQLFDPFGFEPLPTSQPQSTNRPFDPFGGDDFFAPNNNTGMNNNKPAFDPFGNVSHVHSSGSNSSLSPSNSASLLDTPIDSVPYEEKKRNIESLFGPQPITPISNNNSNQTSPTFGTHNNNNNNNSGFGAMNNAFNPFPTSNNNQPSFQPTNNQPSFQPNNNTQPFMFGQSLGNSNGYGNNTNNTFQPVTTTGSNPFLDNSNPFG